MVADQDGKKASYRQESYRKIEKLANELKFGETVRNRERKRIDLADTLLRLLGLVQYSSLRYYRDGQKGNEGELFETEDEEIYSRYDPEAFAKALQIAFDNFGSGENKEKTFWELFSTAYNVKSRGIEGVRLSEYYGVAAELREQEIKEHLAKLGNCNVSDIVFNVLNREKTTAKIKEFLGLGADAELPEEEVKWLEMICAKQVEDIWSSKENDDEDFIGGIDGDIAKEQLSTENVKDKISEIILGLFRKFDDRYTHAYLYYKIMNIADRYELDFSLTNEVPEKFKKIYHSYPQEEESKAVRDKIIGEYLGLQPRTIRQKMTNIELKLKAESITMF